MQRLILLSTIILFTGLTQSFGQQSGTSPVLWPGLYPVINDLRDATSVGDPIYVNPNLYQEGETLDAGESGFSFGDPAPEPELQLFPNPTTSYFSVANKEARSIDRIVVMNMTGREVADFATANNDRYFVGNLPDGLYLISMMSNRDGVVKTLRLFKRSVRP